MRNSSLAFVMIWPGTHYLAAAVNAATSGVRTKKKIPSSLVYRVRPLIGQKDPYFLWVMSRASILRRGSFYKPSKGSFRFLLQRASPVRRPLTLLCVGYSTDACCGPTPLSSAASLSRVVVSLHEVLQSSSGAAAHYKELQA